MKKIIALFLVVSLVTILFAGCCGKHDWIAADCENPKECAKCGKQSGDPLGHTYEWTNLTTNGESFYRIDSCTACSDAITSKVEDISSLGEEIILGKWFCEEEGIEFTADKNGKGTFMIDGKAKNCEWKLLTVEPSITSNAIRFYYDISLDIIVACEVVATPEQGLRLHMVIGHVAITFTN